jgi:N-acyl-phosphatidylethanolamine-hydrolysing phospholipase D
MSTLPWKDTRHIDKKLSVRKPNRGQDAPDAPDKIKATWLGHACFLVEFPSRGQGFGMRKAVASDKCDERGIRILFDPIFSDRCGPNQYMGRERFKRSRVSLKSFLAGNAQSEHL